MKHVFTQDLFFTFTSLSKLHYRCYASYPLHPGGGNTSANRGWKAISTTTGNLKDPQSHTGCAVPKVISSEWVQAWGDAAFAHLRAAGSAVSPADSIQARLVWTSYGTLRSVWARRWVCVLNEWPLGLQNSMREDCTAIQICRNLTASRSKRCSQQTFQALWETNTTDIQCLIGIFTCKKSIKGWNT